MFPLQICFHCFNVVTTLVTVRLTSLRRRITTSDDGYIATVANLFPLRPKNNRQPTSYCDVETTSKRRSCASWDSNEGATLYGFRGSSRLRSSNVSKSNDTFGQVTLVPKGKLTFGAEVEETYNTVFSQSQYSRERKLKPLLLLLVICFYLIVATKY